MRTTPFTTPMRINLATCAPAFVVALLPGLIHPQPTEAQRAGSPGGARPASNPVYVIVPQTPSASDGSDEGYHVTERYVHSQTQNGTKPTDQDSALSEAISDIEQAWLKRDISLLSKHISKERSIVVMVRGKFFYSVDGDDYLSMTRDTFSATKTVSFSLEHTQPKDRGAYAVTGHHTYTDKAGKSHTIQISYVLEKGENGYTLSQVDTTPDKQLATNVTVEPKQPSVTPVPASRPAPSAPAVAQDTVKRSPMPPPAVHQDVPAQLPLPIAMAHPDGGGQSEKPASIIHPDAGAQSSPLALLQRRSLTPPGAHAYPYNGGAPAYRPTGAEWNSYFATHTASYPHYSLHYFGGETAFSPYYYFSGVVPPYIGAVSAIAQAPRTAYVPYPLYGPDGSYRGVVDTGNGDPRSHVQLAAVFGRDPLLADAISDIDRAWNDRDGRLLSRHIDRDRPLAVYMRGKYFYSLDGGDYLNITKDAFAADTTIGFTLNGVQRKSEGIYTLSGSNTYADSQGKSHTVMVSYVLEKLDDDYYLTQVGVWPEKLSR
jgi:hypothetical protein